MPRCIPTRSVRAVVALWIPLAVLCLGAAASRAETVWVKDEVKLNLRTGPGVDFRILAALKTGDAAEILERQEGWTHVRVDGVGDGWVPEGYLVPEPPAVVLLARNEAELERLRARVDELTQKAQGLEESRAELASAEAERNSKLQLLTRENLELRAGARWPEWVTGACMLAAGMIVGAMINRQAGGRRRARVRL
jgi:SH3 domain protein